MFPESTTITRLAKDPRRALEVANSVERIEEIDKIKMKALKKVLE